MEQRLLTEAMQAWPCQIQVVSPDRAAEPKDAVCYGIFAAQLYAGLYLAIGDTFLPGGNVWAIIIVWAAALVGGYIATLVRPLPCMCVD